MARRRGLGLEFVEALPQDGERRLMLAVLIDAVRALSLHESPTPHLRTHKELLKDRAWFLSEDRNRVFSFLNICDSLGLNPDYLRRCVLRRPPESQPIRVRRYAAKAEEAWQRQRKNRGLVILPRPRARGRHGLMPQVQAAC